MFTEYNYHTRKEAYACRTFKHSALTVSLQLCRENESVLIQLIQCWFPGLAISSAKLLIYFSNKTYGSKISNFIKQHSETVMVWNYQNADCIEKKFIVSIILIFGTFVPYGQQLEHMACKILLQLCPEVILRGKTNKPTYSSSRKVQLNISYKLYECVNKTITKKVKCSHIAYKCTNSYFCRAKNHSVP